MVLTGAMYRLAIAYHIERLYKLLTEEKQREEAERKRRREQRMKRLLKRRAWPHTSGPRRPLKVLRQQEATLAWGTAVAAVLDRIQARPELDFYRYETFPVRLG